MSPLLTPEMTGIASPSPLQYAFGGKSGPHAGRGSGQPPLSGDAAQQQLGLLQQQGGSGRQRALYIHIPFCRVRCTFCTFFQHATSTPLVDGYFALLLMELAAKAATPWAQSAPFDAVYVGGGTPTDLQPWQIRELGLAIRGQRDLFDALFGLTQHGVAMPAQRGAAFVKGNRFLKRGFAVFQLADRRLKLFHRLFEGHVVDLGHAAVSFRTSTWARAERPKAARS